MDFFKSAQAEIIRLYIDVWGGLKIIRRIPDIVSAPSFCFFLPARGWKEIRYYMDFFKLAQAEIIRLYIDVWGGLKIIRRIPDIVSAPSFCFFLPARGWKEIRYYMDFFKLAQAEIIRWYIDVWGGLKIIRRMPDIVSAPSFCLLNRRYT